MHQNRNSSNSWNRNQRAIVFNNAASAHIHIGKYEESLRLLVSALRYLKGHGCDPQVADVLGVEVCETLDCQVSSLLCKDGGCNRLKDGLFLFSRPIPISLRSTQQHTDLLRPLTVKVVMFNLGLTYQLIGNQKSGQDDARIYLTKARRLYHLSYCTRTHMHPKTEQHLLPVLVNNMGIVCHRLHQKQQAARSFHGMIMIMMNANIGNASSYRANGNVGSFLANAFEVVYKPFCSASAA